MFALLDHVAVGPALLAVLHHPVLVLGVDPEVPGGDQGAGHGSVHWGPGQGGGVTEETIVMSVLPAAGAGSLAHLQGQQPEPVVLGADNRGLRGDVDLTVRTTVKILF